MDYISVPFSGTNIGGLKNIWIARVFAIETAFQFYFVQQTAEMRVRRRQNDVGVLFETVVRFTLPQVRPETLFFDKENRFTEFVLTVEDLNGYLYEVGSTDVPCQLSTEQNTGRNYADFNSVDLEFRVNHIDPPKTLDEFMANRISYIEDFNNQTSVTVTHQLGRRVLVSVEDNAGNVIDCQISHINFNSFTVSFYESMSGRIVWM